MEGVYYNMNKILIKNANAYTMLTGDKEFFKGDILLEYGKIKAMESQISDSDAEIIDASGLVVLPGLVDAHSHVGMFDFNTDAGNDDANEMTSPNTPAINAQYSTDATAREFKFYYQNGITSVLLTPGSGNVICGLPFAAKTYGDNIFDMTIKAPCALKIAFGGNPKNTWGHKGRMPMTRMGVANVLRDILNKAKDYMEKKDNGENPKYDADLEAIIPALRNEIPFKMHCTQYDMLTAIEIAKEFGVHFSLEHAWGATDYMDEIVESGCDVCYGPIATYRTGAGERRKIDVESVKELDDRGVNVALVTDAPILSVETLINHVGEAVREGVKINRALRMVTINAARVLGVEDRLGSLEIGKDADIAIFKGTPGLDTNAKTIFTIINGEIVYKY